jgi:soluble lytic murein transglycosylase-like protein
MLLFIVIAVAAGVLAYRLGFIGPARLEDTVLPDLPEPERLPNARVGAAVVPPRWPAGWPGAVPVIHDAVAEASATFGVPAEILYGIMRKESAFKTKLVGYKNATEDTTSPAYSPTFRTSYERNKDLRIPGSRITWGEKFTPEQWTALGICQLVPFNLVGKKYGVKAGAPWAALFDVRTQVMCAGDLLKTLFDKYGDWETAVLRYNGARSYQREVLAFAETFRAAQVA